MVTDSAWVELDSPSGTVLTPILDAATEASKLQTGAETAASFDNLLLGRATGARESTTGGMIGDLAIDEN
jgi:hypothetical protein